MTQMLQFRSIANLDIVLVRPYVRTYFQSFISGQDRSEMLYFFHGLISFLLLAYSFSRYVNKGLLIVQLLYK